jgi:hypothetical protein
LHSTIGENTNMESIHYEVQTRFVFDTWENCWTDTAADPYAPVKSTFKSIEEARAEIRDVIDNPPDEPDDWFDESDFRIVKVTTSVVKSIAQTSTAS